MKQCAPKVAFSIETPPWFSGKIILVNLENDVQTKYFRREQRYSKKTFYYYQIVIELGKKTCDSQ